MKTMFNVPSDGSIVKVIVTADCIVNGAQPTLINRRNKVVEFSE